MPVTECNRYFCTAVDEEHTLQSSFFSRSSYGRRL
jgi:hypothetical protein